MTKLHGLGKPNLSDQEKKMIWFAMRASAFARLLYLRRKERGLLTVHAPADDISDYQMLERWWLDLGFDQQQNLHRLMNEMAKDTLHLQPGNLDHNNERMTYFACLISGWGRYQYLEDKQTDDFLGINLSDEEGKELVYLRDWWLNIGDEKQTDIMRLAKEMSREVFGTNELWLKNTKGKHNDYRIIPGN